MAVDVLLTPFYRMAGLQCCINQDVCVDNDRLIHALRKDHYKAINKYNKVQRIA
jgi:hypothetical protein